MDFSILLLSWNHGHPGSFLFSLFIIELFVINIDISILWRLHWDINGNNGNKGRQQKAQQERLEQGRGHGNTRRQVDNVTGASNEQRTARGCSNDDSSNVVSRTAGGGQCNKTRWIWRTMQPDQTETVDNATRAGGDKDSKQQDWTVNVAMKAGGRWRAADNDSRWQKKRQGGEGVGVLN